MATMYKAPAAGQMATRKSSSLKAGGRAGTNNPTHKDKSMDINLKQYEKLGPFEIKDFLAALRILIAVLDVAAGASAVGSASIEMKTRKERFEERSTCRSRCGLRPEGLSPDRS